MAFSGMVESYQKCPALLRRTFADLRELVAQQYPDRTDLQRLAVSSFIVLRFFAAAVMNPKLFGLKGEQPVNCLSISISSTGRRRKNGEEEGE